MQPFTLEIAFALTAYQHVVVEADSIEQACEKALADPKWENFNDDAESSSNAYIAGAIEGDHENIYVNNPTKVEVPPAHAQRRAILDWIGEEQPKAGARSLWAIVDEIVDYHAKEFDGDPEVENCDVSGADTVEWLAQIRLELRDAMKAARPTIPAGDARQQITGLIGTIDSLTHEVEQMKGLFKDDDGNIERALDEAEEAVTDVRAWLDAAMPVEAKVYVEVDGGLLGGAWASVPMPGVELVFIDLDPNPSADRSMLYMVKRDDQDWKKADVQYTDLGKTVTSPVQIVDAEDRQFNSFFLNDQENWDNTQAVAEGWFLALAGGEEWQVQKDDEAATFSTDVAAQAFVLARANAGSDYHKQAVALLDGDE
jgi:hypothetical protein